MVSDLVEAGELPAALRELRDQVAARAHLRKLLRHPGGGPVGRPRRLVVLHTPGIAGEVGTGLGAVNPVLRGAAVAPVGVASAPASGESVPMIPAGRVGPTGCTGLGPTSVGYCGALNDLRHGFASLLIAQGEHPKLISEQLGHASVKITMDRYGHLMDQSYGDASSRLDAALFGSKEVDQGIAG